MAKTARGCGIRSRPGNKAYVLAVPDDHQRVRVGLWLVAVGRRARVPYVVVPLTGEDDLVVGGGQDGQRHHGRAKVGNNGLPLSA